MNNITSINLPETLESIDSKAFEANIIYIPEYVEYVDNAIQEAIEYCLENPGSRGASNPQQCPQIIQQQIETMG